MPVPSVAIIGRPNVGKSSLLNAVAGRRVSIVEPTAGVTRDRVSIFAQWGGRRFELVDTGGLGLVDEALLKAHVTSQIEVAMQEADVVVFVVDAKDGLTHIDTDVARQVRKLDKPVVLVANKVESRRDEFEAEAMHRFGFGDPLFVSALEGTGITDFLDAVVAKLPAAADEEKVEGKRLAIVGKRNSGKSTLVNQLAGIDRVIVSEIPGTTRDAVDVPFEFEGQSWIAIDTAGLRKKSRVQDAIELFSLARAEHSIRRADVVMLMFDVTRTLSQVDKKLSGFVLQNYKPCIIVGNKLDLAEKEGRKGADWEDYVRQELKGLAFCPLAFMSAKDAKGIGRCLELASELYDQADLKVSTGELNRVLQAAKQQRSPRDHGRIPKLFYATQIDVHPPTILVFVNDPREFTGAYDRYLQNQLRKAFAWKQIPIRLVYRRREKVELPPEHR